MQFSSTKRIRVLLNIYFCAPIARPQRAKHRPGAAIDWAISRCDRTRPILGKLGGKKASSQVVFFMTAIHEVVCRVQHSH